MGRTQTGQFPINIQGDVATSLILDPLFVGGPLSDIFKFMPNIKNGRAPMLFASALEDILRLRTSEGFTPQGGLSVVQRFITTREVKGETEQGWAVFRDTCLEQLLRTGPDKGNISGTVILRVILDRIRPATENQLMKTAFFGDESSVDPVRNFANGLFTVLLPQLVTDNLTKRVTSDSGTALASGDAIALLNEMRKATTNELHAFPNAQKVYLVTRKILEALEDDIQAGVFGDAQFKREVLGASTVLTYKGVEVKEITQLDEWAALYMGDVLPGVTDNFNLVLLTHRENLVIGTNKQSDINFISSWYNIDLEKYRTRNAFEIGFDTVHPSLMVAAW